jgi:hypothetical protein
MTSELNQAFAPDSGSKGHQLVEVELNGVPTQIARGHYSGRSLKAALGVPDAYELDEVKHGVFRPIGNDEKTHIEGGEKFVSQVGQGQSS